MTIRMAFVGFRHGHIFALHQLARTRTDLVVVAACEEDAATRETLAARGVDVTHTEYARMLAETDCDVVACGDYFGIRGERLIAAMEQGRHVIGDKPLCTRLEELDRIEALAHGKGLRVGCMLDLRDSGMLQTLRRIVGEGTLGDVHTVYFNAQHPLLYGARPAWYYEDGKHGGTLNDIAIHAIDGIPWITGHAIQEVVAARAWNARLPRHPRFQDAAMLMLRLANGCGILGDLSYLGPDAVAYNLPWYWRFTLTGSAGAVDTAYNAGTVTLFGSDRRDPEVLPFDPPRPGGYLDDFLAEIAGRPKDGGLVTDTVLRAARTALAIQRAADTA